MHTPPPYIGTCPTVVGRSQQFAGLRALVDHARGGAAQVVLLSGDAGIGKSRLAAETKDYARARGFQVLLEGQCVETERAFPYAPVLDLLRTYLRDVVQGATPAAAAPQPAFAGSLPRLLPELALLFPELAAPPVPPVANLATDPVEEKRQVFAAVTQFVIEQASAQPVLLAVEDLHWCDDLSIELRLHLLRRARHLPLLVLVTYRSDELPASVRRDLRELRELRELPRSRRRRIIPADCRDAGVAA